MAMLLDSVAPLVKKISRGSAPTRLATCYMEEGDGGGRRVGGREGRGGRGGEGGRGREGKGKEHDEGKQEFKLLRKVGC